MLNSPPPAGNIDLSNPDHIQQIINVVRDAISETLYSPGDST